MSAFTKGCKYLYARAGKHYALIPMYVRMMCHTLCQIPIIFLIHHAIRMFGASYTLLVTGYLRNSEVLLQ